MATKDYHEKQNPYTYEKIHEIAKFLKSKTSIQPTIGIVCGSGLAGLGDEVKDGVSIPYTDIPEFPVSSVQGHKSNLLFGKLGGKDVVCMQGRFHFYEGYSMYTCSIGIRVMKALGCEMVIVTNAAGGLNKDYSIGDIMLIDDHLNLPGMTGSNPLFGPNDDRWGPRFPAVSDVYDMDLQETAKKVAKEKNISGIQQGVYAFSTGPCFESPAEARALAILGGDTVGMSTVPETCIAKHCGMKVLGLSLVTNKVVMDKRSGEAANHEEVLETGKLRSKDVQNLVVGIVETL